MKLDNGKYELKRVDNRLICLRYGEPWRDVTGDNLIYWLMTELEELQQGNIKPAERFKYKGHGHNYDVLECPNCGKEFEH